MVFIFLHRYYEGKLTKLSEGECENVSTTNEKVVEHAKKVRIKKNWIRISNCLFHCVNLFSCLRGYIIIFSLLIIWLSFFLDSLVLHYNLQVSLQEETIVPKQNLPPLLVPVSERLPEKIDYVGASFGLTTELFGFWKKLEFLPFYISRNPVIILIFSFDSCCQHYI